MAVEDIAHLPLPPAQTDDAHVLPWVLLVLFLGVIYLYYDSKKQSKNAEDRCQKRNDELENKFDASQKYTQTVLIEALHRSSEASEATATILHTVVAKMKDHDFIPHDDESDPDLAAKVKQNLKVKR